MGRSPETTQFFAGILAATKLPLVIDADGLNLLSAHPELLTTLTKDRVVVLTPHPGEMARLAATSIADVQAHRLETARSFSLKTGATVVLKGARTIVAHPDGSAAVNTTGNPAMAKGGSGDLLCGLIAGMVAQYPADTARAVEAAVYLHGLAADLAVARDDEHTLLATESLQQLARAFRFCPTHFRPGGLTGYVCLQGAAQLTAQTAEPNEG